MDRVDSGFDESYCLKAPRTELPSVHRSNTAPTHPRKTKVISSQPQPSTSSMDMNTRRPASENRSSAPRRPAAPRRQSAASSDNSAKSRNRGSGSKPSSRRTSCTLVDPSRPARHYRIKSSQTVPTVTRDIDDVLALHFRSCTLFQNPPYHHAGSVHNGLPNNRQQGVGSDIDSPPYHTVSAPTASHTPDYIHAIPDQDMAFPKQSEDSITSAKKADTTHWMSESTRRREYEKIDRANSGLRGFMRKVVPRCVSGPPPPRFYEKDMSDVGSVRRYRLSLDDEGDEKSTSSLKQKSRRLERPQTSKSTRWGCF